MKTNRFHLNTATERIRNYKLPDTSGIGITESESYKLQLSRCVDNTVREEVREVLHLYWVVWRENACCSECGTIRMVEKTAYCLAESEYGAFLQCTSDYEEEKELVSIELVPFYIRGWSHNEF